MYNFLFIIFLLFLFIFCFPYCILFFHSHTHPYTMFVHGCPHFAKRRNGKLIFIWKLFRVLFSIIIISFLFDRYIQIAGYIKDSKFYYNFDRIGNRLCLSLPIGKSNLNLDTFHLRIYETVPSEFEIISRV